MSAQEKEPKKEPKGGRRARINLFIAPALDDELKRLSRELGTAKVDLARHLIKLGSKLYMIAEDPEGRVYFQEPGEERQRIRLII